MVKRLLIIILPCLVGAIVLLAQAWPQLPTDIAWPNPSILGLQDPPAHTPFPSVPPSPPSSESAQQAVVKRVIDGDTIELEDGRKLRYIGIDTPETKHPTKGVECFGQEAALKNKELVEGKMVRLEKDVSETDRYGRLLRYVWLDDRMVNELLVAEGYAYSSSYPPDIARQEQLKAAQLTARTVSQGLWAVCPLSDL